MFLVNFINPYVLWSCSMHSGVSLLASWNN